MGRSSGLSGWKREAEELESERDVKREGGATGQGMQMASRS